MAKDENTEKQGMVQALKTRKVPAEGIVLLTLAALWLVWSVDTYDYENMELPSTRPVVVELFTSQGCSSCPPAEKFLGTLANNKDILPLAFHVDYWDSPHWKDPFASPANTERQELYARRFGLRGMYTPQMVIDGRYETTGTRFKKVGSYLHRAAQESEAALLPVTFVPREGNGLEVVVGKEGKEKPETPGGGFYDIWLVVFDKGRKTRIEGGENRGRTVQESHIVRDTFHLGLWSSGRKESFVLELDKITSGDTLAVLVQQENLGPYIAAAQYDIKQKKASLPEKS